MNRYKFIVFMIFVLVLGLCLRIYNLGKYDFWYDEAISLISAQNISPQIILDYGKYLTSPVLFCFLLKGWMLWGESEFLLRLLPLIFGFLSIICTYLIGKELSNRKVGLIGAFLLAISPFHIYYSQELRGYTLAVFLTLMSIYFFINILKENKLSSWIYFVLFTTLCLYAHNFTLFILLAENIYLFTFFGKNKKMGTSWMTSQLVILSLYAPWLIIVTYQILRGKIFSAFFWVPQPSIQTVIHTFNVFNLGYNSTKALYLCGFLVFFFLFLSGIWKGVRKKEKMHLLLFWLFIPMIITIFISIILKPSSIYLYRALIYVSPAYYIIVAEGLNNIRKPGIAFTSLSIIIILTTFALWNQYNNVFALSVIPYRPAIFARKEIESAADYIQKDFQEGDAIAHTCRSTVAPFIFYQDNKLEQQWVVSANNTDWLHWKEIFSQPSVSNVNLLKPFLGVDIKQLGENYKRIWLVSSGWELDVRESPDIKESLDNNFAIIRKKEFKGISTYLYKIKEK
jgi:4-amino-4-deoxy-L-arabinose transferase-like glycosyltransferase